MMEKSQLQRKPRKPAKPLKIVRNLVTDSHLDRLDNWEDTFSVYAANARAFCESEESAFQGSHVHIQKDGHEKSSIAGLVTTPPSLASLYEEPPASKTTPIENKSQTLQPLLASVTEPSAGLSEKEALESLVSSVTEIPAVSNSSATENAALQKDLPASSGEPVFQFQGAFNVPDGLNSALTIDKEGSSNNTDFGNVASTNDIVDVKNDNYFSKRFVCSICTFRVKTEFLLQRHIASHADKSNKVYNCSQCSFSCKDSSNLRKHRKTHLEKKLSCDECSYTCSRADHLRKHKMRHTGDLPFVCGICALKFFARCDLERHMRNHTKECIFYCNDCDFSTNRRSTLRKHIAEKHYVPKTFQCPLCEFAPSTGLALRQHMNIHAGVKPFSCPSCDYKSAGKATMIRHISAKHPEAKLPCKYCPFVAWLDLDLTKHMETHPCAIPNPAALVSV